MAFRPFQDPPLSLGSLQDEMSRLMERLWHAGVSTGPFDGQQWAPVLDMYEGEEGYTLWAEVPGVVPEEIEVTHVGNRLTIRGEKRRPSSVMEKDRAVRSERRYGSFNRQLELPEDCDASKLSAKCHAGLLELSIPKSAASRPKSVKIKVDNDG